MRIRKKNRADQRKGEENLEYFRKHEELCTLDNTLLTQQTKVMEDNIYENVNRFFNNSPETLFLLICSNNIAMFTSVVFLNFPR